MRLAGTAVICVLAAFGAAFLVGRAIDHQTPARAATTTPRRITPVIIRAKTTTNAELKSEFAPVLTSLKRLPRRHRHHVSHPPAATPSAPLSSGSPVSPATVPATPVSPAPSAPVQSAPTSSGGGHSGSTHKKTGGSGTTTIG